MLAVGFVSLAEFINVVVLAKEDCGREENMTAGGRPEISVWT